MIFENCSENFVELQHPFESPDLRPISLPMSDHDKTLDGMINLHNAAISFPNSDVFAHYMPPAYGARISRQYSVSGPYQEGEPEYFSDSDFGYSIDYESKDLAPVNVANTATIHNNTEPQPLSRKRKASSSDFEEPQPQKKATVAQVHVQDPEGEFYDLQNHPSPYASYVNGSNSNNHNNSPRPSHHYSTSNASQASLAAPSPHTPAWSPSFTTVKTEQSPRAPMTPLPRPASTSTPSSGPMPKLVRTSTIPQQASPSINSSVSLGVHTQAFNPYAMYPHNKASLRLIGDLDAVAVDWSKEELEIQRKLIVFTRSQSGSVINAEFKVVPQDDWTRSDITINCIWWKERKEAFVTSVDTIALLEQLVAVRFTVEEKNRIRRNLEGFRPLTVSKAKADSEDFFKVIMGFPNPKPRNIEKDVKVFPWKILAHALKKIISKYSASYSSTASTLMTPAASIYAGTEHSSDFHIVPSPAHEMVTQSMPACTVPGPMFEPATLTGRMSAPLPASMPDVPLHLSSMPPPYEMVQPYSYDVVPVQTYPLHVQPPPMTAPLHRMQPAWGLEHFMPDGQVHVQPASAPASAYPRSHAEAAELMMPAVYQHQYNH